jgi:hypothetical protein
MVNLLPWSMAIGLRRGPRLRTSIFVHLSFPKIIAVQPGSEWRGWRQSVGPLDAKARLKVRARLIVIGRLGRKGFAAGASR